MEKLEEFQNIIGYHFENEELLLRALTHSSYANEKKIGKIKDNERLEFLGDAVLEVSSSDYLYHKYPKVPEGELTTMRASIVCEPSLAFLSKKIELGRFLRLGKGENLTGGRNRPSVLSDAFEAVIGAIYLDGGFERAKQFVHDYVMIHMDHMKLFSDSKTILQEEVVARNMDALSYHLVEEKGPDHNKTYVVEALVGEKVFGRGEGHTKKAAEQEAAYQTLLKIRGKES